MASNFFCSICVAGIVIHDGACLLVRHTYGESQGKYLIPGGYVKPGEIPSEAIKREIYEETKVEAEVRGLLSMRFTARQWCAVFLMDYIKGVPMSDHHENDSAIFIRFEDLDQYNITDLSRYLIKQVMNNEYTLLERKNYHPPEFPRKYYELF